MGGAIPLQGSKIMTISKALIISTAESYTRAELVQMRKDAIAKLADSEYVSAASTGAGASYSMSQRANMEELVELYTAAIDYLDNGEVNGGTATAYRIIFHQ